MTLRLIANRARTQADWLISLVKTRASARTFDLRTHFSEGAASNEQLNLRNVPNPLTTQSKAGRCGSFASVGCSRWGQAAAESAVGLSLCWLHRRWRRRLFKPFPNVRLKTARCGKEAIQRPQSSPSQSERRSQRLSEPASRRKAAEGAAAMRLGNVAQTGPLQQPATNPIGLNQQFGP